ALSQVLGVAAQRAITDMRRTVQAYVLRLSVSYFDSTKSGILISRIMSDAEGIRNLVGTGLVQLVGGLVTGAIALGVLFYLNWRLTLIAILLLACFGGGMAYAFTKLRPLFRERGKLNADVTGRLGETLGGIRIVKAYRAERGERLVFTRGAHTLFRNIATTMTGISGVGAFATLIVGAIGILMILEGGHAILSGTMTLGDFFMYGVFIGLVALPLINIASIGTQITEAFAGLDRIREIRRLTTEDAADGARPPLGEVVGDVRFEEVSFEYVPDRDVLKHVSFHAPAGPPRPSSARPAPARARSSVSCSPSADRGRDGFSWMGAISTRSGSPTTGASWASCCRTTSCSTERSPKTSRSPARTPPAPRSRRRRGSPTATILSAASSAATTRSWGSGG